MQEGGAVPNYHVGMEVSPKTLREVEFRVKTRGYHPEDVDHFLEQVAAGIEAMQDRLRHALDRAQRAEASAAEAGGTDDTLRKTLLLAQRTADLAVQEAREQAARILASAEQQAQSILSESEERGKRTMEDAVAEVKAELSRLESSRSQSQQDVETLQRWLEEHKAHLQSSLSDALSAVERAGVLWPAPSTRPVEGAARRGGQPPAPAEPPTENASPDISTDTVMWTPSDEEQAELGSSLDRYNTDEHEQALENFFEDNPELEEEPRVGGRLRRRR